MSEPLVCAVMLTRDRPEMAARAVRCFRAQTYTHKRLLIWDSSPEPECFHEEDDAEIFEVPANPQQMTIGALRNAALSFWTEFPVIIHWDDDDISYPNRIAEQVALLQSSGKSCVGYNEMLFWHTVRREAWLYHNADPRFCVGTSLCYWRKVWERRPFPELAGTGRGEDTEWLHGVDSLGVSFPGEPRMIATIHPGNAKFYDPSLKDGSHNWSRVPAWDDYARSVVEEA